MNGNKYFPIFAFFLILTLLIGSVSIIYFRNVGVIKDEFLKNSNVLANKIILTQDAYKIKSIYNFNSYSGVKNESSIQNKNGEIYAYITPENYKSDKTYNLNSPEVISLLFIEDKSYLYRDIALSIRGVLRSLIKGYGGGSGISQQFVKNIIIDSNEQSIVRKIKELIYTYNIEYKNSKPDIINEYLNLISYGKNIQGIQQAGKIYLGKDELNLEEAFLLNSMLKKPTYYFENQNDLKTRAKYYLGEYYKSMGITDYSFEKLDNLELKYSVKNEIIGENKYIVDYAKTHQISDLNYSIDIESEKELSQKLQEEEKILCEKYNACDIGVIILGKNSEIHYLYGGDYKKSQVDIVQSKLQVGSTLKPFIYARYFEKIKSIQYSFKNFNTCIDSYCPKNWNFSSTSKVSLNTALNMSYNLPIIHLAKDNGLGMFLNFFEKLGLYQEQQTKGFSNDYSTLLGTHNIRFFDLIKAYTVFLNNGKLYPYELDLEKNKSIEKNIIDMKYLTPIKNTLKNNGFDYNYSIKTGTTQDFKEHYIIAFDENYVIGVFLGNKDGTKTKTGVFGINKGGNIIKIINQHLKGPK